LAIVSSLGRLDCSFSASTPSILPTQFAASIGAEVGGRLEGDKSQSQEERQLYSAAQEVMRNTQFVENVDKAVRGVQEKSYRTSDEQGQRLAESVGSSFDRANQARHEMLANYQQSKSYREMASRAEENATSINSNANQAFMQWLQKQPELQHSGEVEKLMTQDPVKAQAYAERFTQEQTKHALNSFQPLKGASPHAIKMEFEKQQSSLPSDETIAKRKDSYQAEVAQSAIRKDLTPHSINREAQNETQQLFKDIDKKIPTAQTTLHQQSEKEAITINKKLEKE